MLTQDDIQQVLEALKRNARDASRLEAVTGLEGVTSLPVVQGGTWKSVPLSLLKEGIGAEQSDWQENDTTETDYIRNRTHFYTVGTALIDEPIDILSGRGNLSAAVTLEEGRMYRLIIDGIDAYDGMAKKQKGANTVVWPDRYADMGAGWAFALNGGEIIAESGGSAQRGVRFYPLQYKMLDAAYLPDMGMSRDDIDDIFKSTQ